MLNNPIFNIDPDGMDVINGWTAKRKETEKRYNKANDEFKEKWKLFDTDNRKEFKASGGNRKEWKEYKKDKKNLADLKMVFENAKEMENKTEQIIEKLKSVAPELYRTVNTAKDQNGNTVDAIIYASTDLSQETYGDTKPGYLGGVNPKFFSKEAFRHNALTIYINPNVLIDNKDNTTDQYSFQHELGHFLHLVRYSNYYLPKMIAREDIFSEGGHANGSKNGKAADDFGQIKNPSIQEIEKILLENAPSI